MEARYRLTARLGAGPLADTFCAQRDESVAVVIKLFQAGTADEQYAKEVAEMAHKLRPYQIPGILQVLDIGFIAGRLAVVRQADGGYNLGQVLSRMAAWGIIFPTPLALWILSELLDTVRRAHAAGVVHGGITPGNIFLCANGQPALCDFGALQALLRKEGIYSSHLSVWRQQLGAHGKSGLSPQKPGRKPKLDDKDRQLLAVLKENAKLKRKLHVANAVIDLQKKAHEVLGLALPVLDEEN